MILCQVALEELHDLKEVWSELSKVWEQIDQMKEQPWVSVQPRKVANPHQLINHFTLRLFVCVAGSCWCSVFLAAPESGCSFESAQELPSKTETVCLL